MIQNSEGLRDQITKLVTASIQEALATQERHLTRKETAQKLNISFPTLKSWVKYGYLNSYKLGRRVFFIESEVNQCIKANKTV